MLDDVARCRRAPGNLIAVAMGHSRGSTPPTRVRRPAGSSPRAGYPPLHPAAEAAPIPWPTAVSPGWRAAPAISGSELCTLSLARPDATVPRKIPHVVIGGLIAPSKIGRAPV